ncbi:MAG TPA: sigma-70 family RNA polymerase sigma factor [Longimicrobium sp.]|nr:sigma-70 family RNA polymerase sigma factor [Longimicrobium sp.]
MSTVEAPRLIARPPAAGAAPHAPPEDEPALAERVRQGDAAAFDTLVNRYMRRAFAVAYRLMGQKEDAEDLVQDAFMTVLQRIDTFEAGRPFSPWFFRILVNRGLNSRKARSLRTVEAIPESTASGGPSPERSAERMELRERLAAAMETLPERQRVIVQLFELEGFGGPEIAEILEISDGTVRWHLHEARKTLRRALAPYERSEP